MKTLTFSDITTLGNQAFAAVPKIGAILGFVLLAMLIKKAASQWKNLSIEQMAGIVIAFALVLK